jgi:hypothetical protein
VPRNHFLSTTIEGREKIVANSNALEALLSFNHFQQKTTSFSKSLNATTEKCYSLATYPRKNVLFPEKIEKCNIVQHVFDPHQKKFCSPFLKNMPTLVGGNRGAMDASPADNRHLRPGSGHF